MLRESLPKIVTESVPGPKAAAVLERLRQIIIFMQCAISLHMRAILHLQKS